MEDERSAPGPIEADEQLREEDVTLGDRLDDRVAEGEDWPGEDPAGPDEGRSEP